MCRSNSCTIEERAFWNDTINAQVIHWNLNVLRATEYFDLHGMTPQGALDFVLQIVSLMEKGGSIQLETGRGNHSPGNIPAIKLRLLQEFGNCSYISICEHPQNPGVLIFSF
ncbi:Smr domain-containing protein [Caenorhabditis elegans]|uniref:Smr domain-containing protein n=1 Tax=Caenorhabditis elegans TaxID=6239 RepID=Q9N496_CAEEL|nr:Smr domain-containing protein [Caenorhabditis elegans]CCD72981.1 Smr domain-containing protein [Caenorhabditis elegans]|eukprot:NP_494389.2 Uncharacterized protein CELE_Y110A2AL.10 [Caenorhabditis elegans]